MINMIPNTIPRRITRIINIFVCFRWRNDRLVVVEVMEEFFRGWIEEKATEVLGLIDENGIVDAGGKDEFSIPFKQLKSQLSFSIKSGIWKSCSLTSLCNSSSSQCWYFRQDYDEMCRRYFWSKKPLTPWQRRIMNSTRLIATSLTVKTIEWRVLTGIWIVRWTHLEECQ